MLFFCLAHREHVLCACSSSESRRSGSVRCFVMLAWFFAWRRGKAGEGFRKRGVALAEELYSKEASR